MKSWNRQFACIDLKIFRIQFRIRGRKTVSGVLLALASILLCHIAGASLIARTVLPIACLVLAVLELDIPPLAAKWLNSLWLLATPLASIFCMQLLLDESTLSLMLLRLILGMTLSGILLVLTLLLTANLRAAVLIDMIILVAFSAVNYFVYTFRGSEFAPADILSVRTAWNVADQYSFVINAPFAYACILAALFCFAGFCIPKQSLTRSKRLAFSAIAAEMLFLAVFLTGAPKVTALHFLQTGSVRNGYLLNFTLQIAESIVTKPDNYSLEQVSIMENQYADIAHSDDSHKTPDIIVIMNESFTDMEVLGENFNTNIEVTPFFHSLSENTIRGYALSSVMGGGTANSEYEFLSGNTMGFLPSGSIVYQQFIQGESHTILQHLKDAGYTCVATHPCPAKNWLRGDVYPLIGFDDAYFEEEYPHTNMVRGFVSDQEMYEQIIMWYEQRDTSSPYFLFGITMQNHGSYDYVGENYEHRVCLEGYSQEYPMVEQYLTLLNYSDQALEYLISYFENVENDVIIVFFGDHFPKLDAAFYEEVHGGPLSTSDEQMLQYTVPFFIWANYDIEEKTIPLTSLNFLSNYMLQAAGLELPAYNAFLADVNTAIPAMNAFGYYSITQGAFIPYNEACGTEAEVLNSYRYLQYNCLFDTENTSQLFFPTRGSTILGLPEPIRKKEDL